MKCPECNHEMVPCPREFAEYSKIAKTGELICQLHGTMAMINQHRA